MTQEPRQTEDATHLRRAVHDLRSRIDELQQEQAQSSRRRLVNLAIFAVALAIVVHIGIMVYLNLLKRDEAGAPERISQDIEIAFLDQEELSQLEDSDLDDRLSEDTMTTDVVLDAEPFIQLEADAVDAQLATNGSDIAPTLGGAGGGGGGWGSGMGGGGASTTFFGVTSRGSRFAYVVDRSGSMGRNSTGGLQKISVALRELARSITSLPDSAEFYLLFFDSTFSSPPMQKDWMPATPYSVRNVVRWLNQVAPGGGTHPRGAFQHLFAMEERPDVIFFLTDGKLQGFSSGALAKLNSSGKRVVINTIAFGSDAEQKVLRDMARDSGGEFRFVSTGASP